MKAVEPALPAECLCSPASSRTQENRAVLNRARVAGLPLLFTLVLSFASPAGPAAAPRKAPAPSFPPITLAVDATDAPRQILHSHAEMQAPPGPLTLVFAKWIPGEHAPSGPLTDIAGLHFQA
ncbi:MAG TPA: hypothetical protein VMM92_04875, partial [Thermoanaerobaculia bacterium]|nr:hypothetical protein [Thermoanaerobaculia bacterium]